MVKRRTKRDAMTLSSRPQDGGVIGCRSYGFFPLFMISLSSGCAQDMISTGGNALQFWSVIFIVE